MFTLEKTMIIQIRFINTKVVVWEGTWAEYLHDYNGGLDDDNCKTFETVEVSK